MSQFIYRLVSIVGHVTQSHDSLLANDSAAFIMMV